MSVTVSTWGGRWGNHVFQYVFARLLSESNNLKLSSTLNGEGILEATPTKNGAVYEHPIVEINHGTSDLRGILDRNLPPAKYIVKGYFQRENFYLSRKDTIKSFLAPVRPIPKETNKEDIVANFRLGDYLDLKISIHPDWYLKILDGEKFKRLHIVSDTFNERYFSYFKKFDPIIHMKSPVDDWYYLLNFDRFICPSSTFSWWAAFLGNASKIWTHKRWVKIWTGDVELGNFNNGIRIDGPFVDEKDL